MSIINYELYLDGDEWPSESSSSVVRADGLTKPDMKPVIDMPPQYAASALGKLVRWARDGALTLEDEELYERQVRSSTLGRLLARRALNIEDFELYSEHGLDREPMSNHEVARMLAKSLWAMLDLPPEDVGRLATELALALSNDGYQIYKESG